MGHSWAIQIGPGVTGPVPQNCATQPPTAQHHRVLPARPERCQAEGRRGQPPGALPAAVPRPLLPTCGPQNQTLSTPRPFPSPPPAKPRRGSPEFGPPAPASRPRDHIASIKFIPGSFLQNGNSNSVAFFLILVNCVENHREIRKM
jgi:hypothetical protein